MKRIFTTLALGAATAALAATGAQAQSGSVDKAVGGYSFEDAAKEAAETKNFHSNDGVSDLRTRHAHCRQRLLRPGLCRRAQSPPT